MQKLIAILGATATGKSELAIKIAHELNTEIISLDSMQIYKGLDIGTAKVTVKNPKHHLIDIVEPHENFNAYDYVQYAKNIIAELASKNKIPIVVGGTGLYFESLIYDYSFTSDKDDLDLELRESLYKKLEKIGKENFHKELEKLDKEEAAKIHPNNKKRMVRAMEICLQSGGTKRKVADKKELQYDLVAIEYVAKDRVKHKEIIKQRVQKMFNDGLENEVRNLLNIGCDFKLQSMQAIGYKEFENYFKGEINKEELINLISKNTANYAKRQRTWFKRYGFVKKFNIFDEKEKAYLYILDEIKKRKWLEK